MKKALLIAALFAASAAQATNINTGDTTNNYLQPQSHATGNGGNGGNGGAGGAGGHGGTAIAGAASAAEAKANAAAIAAQQQGQAQGQQQSSTSSVKNSGNSESNSGAAVLGSGNSKNDNKSQASGNKTSTNVNVGGDHTEAAASGVFAAPIPTVATSCRLYMFGGGTNVSGAVSGSIPLGNDQTCLSGTNVNNMLRVNQQFPGTFTKADITAEACKVEGMSTAAACKQ